MALYPLLPSSEAWLVTLGSPPVVLGGILDPSAKRGVTVQDFPEHVKNSVGKVWAILVVVATVLTVATAIVGAYGFLIRLDDKVSTLADQLAKLEGRLKTLEDRVHTLTVAPVIANSADCANYARQLAKAREESSIMVTPYSPSDPPGAGRIRSVMEALGCNAPQK